jgi:hypothetical protein
MINGAGEPLHAVYLTGAIDQLFFVSDKDGK